MTRRAPEVLATRSDGQGRVSPAVDIWALGITMIQMLERSHIAPYTRQILKTQEQMLAKVGPGNHQQHDMN